MARTRRNGRIIQNISSRRHEASTPMEAKAYVCTTNVEKMNPILVAQGIQIQNFAYDFSIPELLNQLSYTNDGSFYLPLHVIEASFHLPLHPFFCHFLDEYRIAPRKLSCFSWWVATAYFIKCNRREEVPLIIIFQNLYQLKAYN
ncbi:hypothetical protein J1N35_037786 [Gossypium stocksii]|uniref:Uncharacterized protein n=1 Tax=Gossypium stocksii TaxID=47602 RepID=A0A9D3UKU3_9ROSI|nr:hypothetical protein J1N35_037786 [Gossypium stocksii]